MPEARWSSEASSSRDLIGDNADTSCDIRLDCRIASSSLGCSVFDCDIDSRANADGPSTGVAGFDPLDLMAVFTDGLTGSGLINGLARGGGGSRCAGTSTCKGASRCKAGFPPAASSFSFDRPPKLGNWPRPETGLDLTSSFETGIKVVVVAVAIEDTSTLDRSDSTSGIGGVRVSVVGRE
jgi:hypothetical protein